MQRTYEGAWSLAKERAFGDQMQGGKIAEFDGGYARNGVISLIIGICDVCHADKLVLAIDASENEYKPGAICRDCIEKAFDERHPGDHP